MTGNAPKTVSDVRDFWNTEACGTHFIQSAVDEADFYAKYREYRYKTEWHIPLVVPFEQGRGKKVLEIGLGNGVDGTMWAKHGADFTGVDLTPAAVASTQRHFEVLGLRGSFHQGNAQELQFPNATFDIVYSHGVLHHTPEPRKAFAEVARVLKPGGQCILMLYHRHSFNYYIRIMTLMRLRLLAKILWHTGRWGRDRANLKNAMIGVRGNDRPEIWQIHYENWLRAGWSYLKAKNFVHHCTDGPECPFAFVYSDADVRRIFGEWFTDISTRATHFPLNRYPLLKELPFGVEKWAARTMGWYLFVFMTKKA